MKKTFSAWLKGQSKRDDAIGDLSRDVQNDRYSPRGRASRNAWYLHLMSVDASDGALDALCDAWAEYAAHEQGETP